jgi:hypothetical protein
MSLRHEGVFEPESIFNDFVQLLIALPAYFFLLLIYSSNAAPQSRSAHNSAH